MRLLVSVRRAAPWLLLALLPLLAHAPLPLLRLSADPLFLAEGLGRPDSVLPGLPGWNDPNTGFTVQALGGLAARDWLHGIVPWWNPYSGVGLPLAGEMQPAAFFLPFNLLLATRGGFLWLKIVVQMLAGWACFALLRQLGLSPAVVFVGGALFALNGTFAWVGHSPINPVPFLPLLLLGIERALACARAGRRGGWAWVTVAVAYSLAAGFPETAFLDGLMAAAWAAFRLAGAPAAARLSAARKLAAGGVAGVLVAAPAVLPFLQLLPVADVGPHPVAGMFPLPASVYPLFLVPYLYGPIDYDGAIDWALWGVAGGYLGMPTLLLALLALLRRGPERGLRCLLAAWVALCVGKTAQLPGVAELVNLIPFVSEIWFARFAVPSWELASVLLAAFALDDWVRGRLPGGRRLLAALLACGAVLAVTLPLAAPMARALLARHPGYPWFLAGSLIWSAATLAAVASLISGRPGARRSAALFAVVIANALLLFAFPLLSGTRKLPLDGEAIAFLRRNLGLGRFYTLGPIPPNYAAYAGIASINHNYLPLPRRWADYIHAHLDPGADSVSFDGRTPPTTFGGESRRMALVRRLDAYAAVGVKYVLAPPGSEPFATPPDLRLAPGGAASGTVTLRPGEKLFGGVPAALVPAGQVARVALDVAPGADGTLRLDLCSPRACGFAVAPVPAGPTLAWTLTPPLELNDGDDLRYQLTRVDGAMPLGVPLWPEADAPVALRTPAGPVAGQTPGLALRFAPFPALPRVFRSPLADVFELPNPAPYFTARGAACTLTPSGREAVSADCDGAATLLRPELFYPGWRAEANGAAVPISQDEEIFQAVALPAGHTTVRFRYAPPFVGWAFAACGIGLVGLWRGARR